MRTAKMLPSRPEVPTLRDYQQECVDAILRALKQERRADVYASVGAGKTIIFCALAARAKQAMLIVVPRIELMHQTREKLALFGIDSGLWYGNQRRVMPITVVTSQSVRKIPSRFPILVVDEAHMHQEAYADIDRDYTLRFSGTPWLIPDWRPCFSLSIAQLTQLGHLVPARYVAPSALEERIDVSKLHIVKGDFSTSAMWRVYKDKITFHVSHALLHIEREQRKRCLWICVNIDHALIVRSMLESAEIATSKTKHSDQAISRFRRGDVRHLVSVSMLNVGFDVPAVDAIVFLRATHSPCFWVQSVGRGLRPAEGKKDCLILDYGENVSRLGMVDQISERTISTSAMQTQVCVACDLIYDKTLDRCPRCGELRTYLCEFCLKMVSSRCIECFVFEHQRRERDYLRALVDCDFREQPVDRFYFRFMRPRGRRLYLFCMFVDDKVYHVLPSRDGSTTAHMHELLRLFEQDRLTSIVSLKHGVLKAFRADRVVYALKRGRWGLEIERRNLP